MGGLDFVGLWLVYKVIWGLRRCAWRFGVQEARGLYILAYRKPYTPYTRSSGLRVSDLRLRVLGDIGLSF